MLVLFVATVFLGAGLLFVVQPMFGRMILPRLGGTPAVWNTALVFYQTALLFGYAYAHFSTRWLGVRRQALLHAALLFVPLLFLPIVLPLDRVPPAGENPIPWILALMAVTVGVPFFVVSTTGPLLQRWFAETGHRTAHDPYFLYAASNLGSMLGLLGYPFLLEPGLPLAWQSNLWAWGYAALALLTIACAIVLRRRTPAGSAIGSTVAHTPVTPNTSALSARRRLRWVLLAFVPSSLMVGVTTYLTTDIAAIPLLWVLPLALYLMTFTLAFAGRPLIPQQTLLRALPFVVLSLVIVIGSRTVSSIPMLLAFHLGGLFVIAMVCHGQLAQDRPPASQLTEFYLWIALGGVFGGAFNGLLAPLVFPTVLEYPIVIVLACLLAPALAEPKTGLLPRVLDFALPAVLGLALFALTSRFQAVGLAAQSAAFFVLFPLPAFLCFTFSRRPLRFGLGVAALLLATTPFQVGAKKTMLEERNFFGVVRVAVNEQNQRAFYHGSTVHGLESLDPERRGEPIGYYHKSGPIGQVFQALGDSGRLHEIGVTGLGAGGLVGYARAEQRWTVYEIDPAVVRVARDPRYFTFLSDSPVPVETRVGDGRLLLEADRDKRFDLLVLDAYSSDAVPVHLLTRECLRLYLDRLAPHGVLLFNISNRHLDLAPVVGRLAQDAGLAWRVRADQWLTKKEFDSGHLPSVAAVMARAEEDLGPIAHDPRWTHEAPGSAAPLWTDDYSSLVSVLRFGKKLPDPPPAVPAPPSQNASSSPK